MTESDDAPAWSERFDWAHMSRKQVAAAMVITEADAQRRKPAIMAKKAREEAERQAAALDELQSHLRQGEPRGQETRKAGRPLKTDLGELALSETDWRL